MIMETERLYMLSPHEVSANNVLAYYYINREFLKEFSPTRSENFYTEAHQEELIRQQINDWDADKGYRFYLTLKGNTNYIIGSIALTNIVRGTFQSCFLGYQLDAQHANHGYMTEAVKRIVEFGFQGLKLHRIEGNIIPRNQASRKVLEKCGFTEEGLSKKYLKINDVWEDHLHYVILNEDME